MKECLSCKVDISKRAQSTKFCSTKCRVSYHRKNGKTKSISPIQATLIQEGILGKIYDAIMEKISTMGNNNQINRLETIFSTSEPQAPKIIRSFEYYQQQKLNCESMEDWVKIKEMIIEDPNLTQKQKNLLIT
jgi:hypothetical protein